MEFKKPTTLSRRDVLRLTLATPLVTWAARVDAAKVEKGPTVLDLEAVSKAPARVVPTDPAADVGKVKVARHWKGPICRATLTNKGKRPVRIKEVVLADIAHALPPETRVYGEGFQMLSQTGGTLGELKDIGNFTDRQHYRMPMPEDAATFYGLTTLNPPGGDHSVLAFTSCHRFSGQFYCRPASLQVVLDTEGLELAPGETWTLEELVVLTGKDRAGLLAELATHLCRNHPPLKLPAPPSGWCSWYCYGADVTAQQILDNLDVIAKSVPGLKYIQIDDGYQSTMGDWLETGTAFGGDVREVLKQIRERGFEPALWVAPFIAEARSNVFKQHPDWFMKDDTGAPLPSDKVTFGGWRLGPWYALDGTHPEVQKHLEHVFSTMRNEWGVTYFKHDADVWGAMHGARLHDPKATRIEAYRLGMKAVLRGSGDAFTLGSNHPIWGSLGLLHGSRSSMDVRRAWSRLTSIGRQNIMRSWQNGRLWWNDPDAVVLNKGRGLDVPPDEYRFHATTVYAAGGMILSGDDLTQIPPDRLEMLRKLQPPTGVSARFDDEGLRVGVVALPGGRKDVCLLNWDDAPQKLTFRLEGRYRVKDLWSDEDRGVQQGEVQTELPAHCGTVLVCTPEA